MILIIFKSKIERWLLVRAARFPLTEWTNSVKEKTSPFACHRNDCALSTHNIFWFDTIHSTESSSSKFLQSALWILCLFSISIDPAIWNGATEYPSWITLARRKQKCAISQSCILYSYFQLNRNCAILLLSLLYDSDEVILVCQAIEIKVNFFFHSTDCFLIVATNSWSPLCCKIYFSRLKNSSAFHWNGEIPWNRVLHMKYFVLVALSSPKNKKVAQLAVENNFNNDKNRNYVKCPSGV